MSAGCCCFRSTGKLLAKYANKLGHTTDDNLGIQDCGSGISKTSSKHKKEHKKKDRKHKKKKKKKKRRHSSSSGSGSNGS